MKKKNVILYVSVTLILVAAFLMAGCGKGFTPEGSDWTIIDADDGGGVIWESNEDSSKRKITGTFVNDFTLESDYTWYLDRMVFIGDDTADTATTLTIQAGTTILGLGGTTPGTLVITRFSKIDAQGTADAPIVMSSAKAAGERGPGDWGGLVINGIANVNTGENNISEGNAGLYGPYIDDNDAVQYKDDDSSGTLKYVRVEYAGKIFTSEDELNGIAFQGVGSGTTVDYVQVHQNKDDGVEFFGGDVNVKHVVLTGNQDDSLDWTSGWTGTAQYVVIQHYPETGDKSIEADNLEDNPDKTPRSDALLANFTMVGSNRTGDKPGGGCLFRRGTNATLYNAISTKTKDGKALDETHDSGDANSVSYYGVLVDGAAEPAGDSVFSAGAQGNAASGTHNLPSGHKAAASGDNFTFAMQPTAAPDGTAADLSGVTGLETAGYIGAIEPGGTDWTADWITTAQK